MTIETSCNDKTMTIALKGKFDYTSAAEFKEMFNDNFKGIWELIIDLADLEYISSAGMRVLLENELIMKKRGGMSIINANEEILKVIKLAGFDRFLKIN